MSIKRCQYCGFKSSNGSMNKNRDGWYCRKELPCFNRILGQLRCLREVHKQNVAIGDLMSNVCFNLSQYTGCVLTENWTSAMRQLSRQWGNRKREIHND